MKNFLKVRQIYRIDDLYTFDKNTWLGKGAYGTVYKAKRNDGYNVALKLLELGKLRG